MDVTPDASQNVTNIAAAGTGIVLPDEGAYDDEASSLVLDKNGWPAVAWC